MPQILQILYFEPGPFNYPPQTALNYLFKSSYLNPFAKHITLMKAELTLHNDVPLYSSPVCFSTAKVNFPTIKMIALELRRLFMTTSMKCAPHNPTVNNTDLSNPNHVLLSQAKYNIRHKLLYQDLNNRRSDLQGYCGCMPRDGRTLD